MVNQRELGKNTGVFVNPLGLGCMGMSKFYGKRSSDEESFAVLNRAIELGCTFWDTADIYGTGKFLGQSGKSEYVRQACEASLKRLGVDTIGLYFQHRPDPDTPIEGTVKALTELVNEGKVRYIGLSEMSSQALRRAHKVHAITAIQMEFSPWTLDIKTNGVLEIARELGVRIVCYSPLGRGFLTDDQSIEDLDPDDWRRTNPGFSPENFSKNLVLVENFEVLASKKRVTPSELVLAWMLSQGKDIFAIPGTRRMKYLEKNVRGGQLELSAEETAELSATTSGFHH